jgi:hypothetical protein
MVRDHLKRETHTARILGKKRRILSLYGDALIKTEMGEFAIDKDQSSWIDVSDEIEMDVEITTGTLLGIRSQKAKNK